MSVRSGKLVISPFLQTDQSRFETNTQIRSTTTATLRRVIRRVAAVIISVDPEIKHLAVVGTDGLRHGDHAHRNALLDQALLIRVNQLQRHSRTPHIRSRHR